MQQDFSFEYPLSNTGMTQELQDTGCLELKEYEEVNQRGWSGQSWLASCPVTGRVVRLDGVNIQLPPDCLDEFMRFLLELFRADYPFELASNAGSKWYKERYEGPFGISILASPVSQSNRGWFKCDFLGRASLQLSLKDWRELVLWIDAHGGYTSMAHLNVDDYRREVTPLMMVEAVEQPGEKTRNRMSKGIIGFGSYVWHHSSSKLGRGDTITFGKRGKLGGGKQYCCYDKNVESEGRDDCIRHELRLYRDKARQFFSRMVEWAKFEEWEELWIEEIAGEVYGSVDFLDVSSYNPDLGKLKDCPRLEWWDNFIKNRSIIKLAAKKKKPSTLDKMVGYLRRQIAPTIATVFSCFAAVDKTGDTAMAFLWGLILLGEEKMNKTQRKIQAEHKAMYCKT